MTMQLHADAVLVRLRTHGTAGFVHDGKVPDPPPSGGTPNGSNPPYRLLYFTGRYVGAAESPGKSSLIHDSREFVMEVTVHNVASTAQGARGLSERSRAALLDTTLAVAGRECHPVRHVDNYTPGPDERTGVDYFDVVDVYRLVSVPGQLSS